MKILCTFFVSFLLVNLSQAQQFSLNAEQSEVIVTGTSTVHDWESIAEEIGGTANITSAEGALESIESLTFTVDASSIKSGKRAMDGKTRDALKAKKHPVIKFQLGEIQLIEGDSVKAAGSLSLAGVTREIMLTGAYSLSGETLLISGEKEINMRDYDIEPPTAMLGTLKTGEIVTVVYNVQFSKN